MFYISESTVRLLLFWGGILFFLVLELLVPYRESSISKIKRWINNLSLTLFNSIIINLVFATAITSTATYAQAHHILIYHMMRIIGFKTAHKAEL